MSTIFSSMTPQQQMQNRALSILLSLCFPLYRQLVVSTLVNDSVILAKEYSAEDRNPLDISPEASKALRAIMKWDRDKPAGTMRTLFQAKNLKGQMKTIMAEITKVEEKKGHKYDPKTKSLVLPQNSVIDILLGTDQINRWREWRDIILAAYGLQIENQESLVTEGLDRHSVMQQFYTRVDNEWRKNLSIRRGLNLFKGFPVGLIAFPAMVIVDVVEKMCKEGLLNETKIFPIDGLLIKRTHAQVRSDIYNYLHAHINLKMAGLKMLPKEEQEGASIELICQSVTWHLGLDFRTWRRGKLRAAEVLSSAASKTKSKGSK
ncbi:uncharacterized protein LOC62_04G006532 [Vanrija pseudolonga]|uniref:Uncharacterized protein n=1 Tax=Vanrija pseudolonga TaxID=143232 RepID=A0AAF1BJS0_9TREE|nr:hypothetical protein LOC62_04G006532 [Vanrija pseudolonga]